MTDAHPHRCSSPLQWAYTITYSTYTSLIWRIRKASGSTNNRADITAAVSSPLTANIALPTGTNALRGRFTIEVCMANDQAPCDVSSTSTDRWSSASTVFALGAQLQCWNMAAVKVQAAGRAVYGVYRSIAAAAALSVCPAPAPLHPTASSLPNFCRSTHSACHGHPDRRRDLNDWCFHLARLHRPHL